MGGLPVAPRREFHFRRSVRLCICPTQSDPTNPWNRSFVAVPNIYSGLPVYFDRHPPGLKKLPIISISGVSKNGRKERDHRVAGTSGSRGRSRRADARPTGKRWRRLGHPELSVSSRDLEGRTGLRPRSFFHGTAMRSTPETTSTAPAASFQVQGSPSTTTPSRITNTTLNLSTGATSDAGASCNAR
jgi:hypothetical protein